MKVAWNPKTGLLHFESNLPHIELLGVLDLVRFAAVRQMASGQGTGEIAQGIVRAPALQPRKLP